MTVQTGTDELVTESSETHLFSVIRGYYETKALLGLWRTGLFQRVGSGEQLEAAALVREGYDGELLGALLDYLTVRGYLRRDGELYTLTARGAALVPYAGYLGTMVGAYEPITAALEELITGRKHYGQDVHRSVPDLASGLTSLEDNLMSQFPALLPDQDFAKVMDLGCGSARMLCRIVKSRPGITGVGVDASDEICDVARRTVADDRLSDRVVIVAGDAGQISRIPASARNGVDLVTVMFVLHELFRQRGREGVLECLRGIADMLGERGRLLVVEVESVGKAEFRDDLLFTPEYEFMHVLTHQRLASRTTWAEIASEAGLRVERIVPLQMCRSFCLVLAPGATPQADA